MDARATNVTFNRLMERGGLVSTIVLMLLIAFPPRTAAPFLPRFFFYFGLFTAFISLLGAIFHVRGVSVKNRGTAFTALALILAAYGASRMLSLPLLLGSIVIQITSLSRRTSPEAGAGTR
jgi:hypothetical protein